MVLSFYLEESYKVHDQKYKKDCTYRHLGVQGLTPGGHLIADLVATCDMAF